MTLSEMAAAAKATAAKKEPGPAPVRGAGGSLRLNAREKCSPKSGPDSDQVPVPLSPRPLGAECCGECLPMDWPATDAEANWEEARHATPAEVAVVLSACGQWAWLCLLPSPNFPPKPLLLKRWPVAGRLTQESGGLAVVDWDPARPCPACGGWHFDRFSYEQCQPAIAPNAGSDGAGLYRPECASAAMLD
jgi:hypothetical protein